MQALSVEEKKLKRIFKEAILEVFEERGNLLKEIIEEAIEDVAMEKAIKESESAKYVTRKQVMACLEK